MSFIMIPNYTIHLGHSMNISSSILGCRNASSNSHRPTIYTSSSWYNVSTIRILIGVSDSNGKNESVKSTSGNCMYPLTTFLYFRRINPSGSSLLLNTHLIGTGFIPLYFKALHFVVIHAFLDRNFFTS